jgi:pseudaminic acid synthase
MENSNLKPKKISNVFIIAELSANHGGDINIAIETIQAAKRAGADAIKLQTYTADTLTLNSDKEDFIIKSGSIWDGKTYYELYQDAFTPWEWHAELFDFAKQVGLICFSSPLDNTAVDFLEELNTPIYKIPSFEITDVNLIYYAASKQKPIILSTGIAEYDDIELAVRTCREAGNNDITLLKCTSSYPAPIEEVNLVMMQRFAKDFKVKVGVSDHTLGITVPIVATALGATIIEKHFILDKTIKSPDASFSLDEKEFTEMVEAVRNTEKAIGKESYKITEKQISGKSFSRSLYIAKDIKRGEMITEENVRSVRPGYGLHPKYFKQIIGRIAVRDLENGTALKLGDLQS